MFLKKRYYVFEEWYVCLQIFVCVFVEKHSTFANKHNTFICKRIYGVAETYI